MIPNPVLKKLGFQPDDRVVIIHTDDIGMCQASVDAFAELWKFGLISSGAVMVPCPWFLEAAEFAKVNPNVDLGVHLTLTSEYDTYRWGPISTRDTKTGLMDQEGYFHRSSEGVWEHADPEAALWELDEQISRAIRAGMNLTHIDTHMGSVANSKFMEGYIQLAVKYRLPPMVPRMSVEELVNSQDVDQETAKMVNVLIQTLEEMGIPLIDHLSGLHLDNPKDRMGQAKQVLSSLKPGISHFIIHPAKDTPELRHITDTWDCRSADFETFMSDDLRDFIVQEGIQVIGYKDLKELMPNLA
jgi:predicted glycoside hydrolase/deacetylase ChbG (UPF0249 family)